MSNFRRFFFALALGGILLAASNDALAQRRKSAFQKDDPTSPSKTADPSQPTQTANSDPTQPNAQADDENEFAPQDVTLEVKGEGIRLIATWFPPIVEEEPKQKKPADPAAAAEEKEPEPWATTVPFILVHDWTRSRKDLIDMATFLQSKGHAVLVPDLRGHGGSLRIKDSDTVLDHRSFKKNDQASAVADIDQCKRFLIEKNNDKLINIDLLNVVAVGDSAHLAIAWAITDWSWDSVAGVKQGKDVKSLILFSPTKTFAGSTLKKLTKLPLISGRNRAPLPMLVVWGADSVSDRTCNDFIKILRKTRPEISDDEDLAERWKNQNLFHYDAPTAMEGFELAGSPQAKQVWSFANDFVSQKVTAFSKQFPWALRGPAAVLKARKELE